MAQSEPRLPHTFYPIIFLYFYPSHLFDITYAQRGEEAVRLKVNTLYKN